MWIRGDPGCLVLTDREGHRGRAVALREGLADGDLVLGGCSAPCRLASSCADGELLVSEPKQLGALSYLARRVSRRGGWAFTAGIVIALATALASLAMRGRRVSAVASARDRPGS
ncbi:MAG TPA: hypothetical protein VMK42_03815 [Anaeromyxobacteraceae bacterium]|nr:hypothetical protein [Anaeromyxobacteraceae bacterium]